MTILKTRACANVLGIPVEATNMEGALSRIHDALRLRRKGYVCLANVHGVMEAQRDSDLADIYANAFLTLPDGMPTVWVGRAQGRRGMRRIAGPDLMLEVFRRREFASYTHYLCGGKSGVAAELCSNLTRLYPWARIVGTCTPPFSEMSLLEREAFITSVREAKPDIVWVGISTPKQEGFMHRFLPLLDVTLMFGVGAAFDFHTGRIRNSPQWIKTAGLQWLHRLIQDPRHLWKRHLRNNPRFILSVAMQFAGWHRYSARTGSSKVLQEGAGSPMLLKTGSKL